MGEQAGARLAALQGLPLFAGFTDGELRLLADACAERTYGKGQDVCREGDPGDAFYVVLGGELEVWTARPEKRVLNRLHAGDTFGEISLLLQGPRTATVTANRSTRLLSLAKSDFEQFVSRNSYALERLVRSLCKRIVALSHGETDERPFLVVATVGRRQPRERKLVATALATLLGRVSGTEPVILVIGAEPGVVPAGARRAAELALMSPEDLGKRLERTSSPTPGRLALALDLDAGPLRSAAAIEAICSKLGARHRLLVLDVESSADPVRHAIEDLADAVVEVSRDVPDPGAVPPDGTRRYCVVALASGATSPIPINQCEPFVLPHDRELATLGDAALVEAIDREPFRPAVVPLHRLARKLLGTSVGVALGGGAAFGIAHVGVLDVLERNGIPVDLVAGTSFGSIVAIGYGAGLRPADMASIARRIGTKTTTLSALDFTLTRPGFLAGDRLIKIFAPLIGKVQRFEELRVPCRTVAADLETGERISIGAGRLDAAFRASCSVPMLWSPVRHDGRVLVDGGIVDPVPAEVALEMGADVCFAVNVVPPPRKGVDNVLTRLYRTASWLNPLAYLGSDRALPSLFDVIMNSIQTLEHELGQFKALSADVRINPDLSGLTWIEFYRPEDLIERGAAAAERALPEIRRVLAEKIARRASTP